MFLFKKYLRFAYRSPKWSSIRKQHLANNPSCSACGRDKKLEVHHVEPVHTNPEKELDLDNLITLCDDPCHFVFGHLLDYKSWNKNVIDDCKVYLNRINNKPYK
jgi:5-methylcytosine-specific restriction endonuclease McrA